MACERITAGIVSSLLGERPIKAMLDPYNPVGSTLHVRFTTSKKLRWETDPRPAATSTGSCATATGRPSSASWSNRILGCAPTSRTTPLGLEVPYRHGSRTRRYLPDFVVLVDDGRGDDDLLRLMVEVKGYRGEDAKDKKTTMDTYWVPGVNNLGAHGRWAFAELTDVYTMEEDFEEALKAQFQALVERAVT